MKVAQALELLKQNNPEDEIAIQWYVKEDMDDDDEKLTDEVWKEAIRLFDKWNSSDMGDVMREAIFQATKNVKKVNQ